MLPTLTYLQFHLVFSLPVLALLWYLAPRYEAVRQRRATVGIAILVAIAYFYTTPWISYMIRQGAWWYADGAVLVRALSIPLGEYLFFTIQTVVTAFALHLIGFDPTFREGDFDRKPRAAGVVAGVAMVGGGLWLTTLDPSYLYLGGLIAWVGPVVALQWAVGGGYLVRTPRMWLAATLIPAAYFWVADRIAIAMGTWKISAEYTTGVAVLGLPVEEMLFFAAAGVMTVNGLVLFEWVLDWNDRRGSVAESVPSRAAEPDVPGPEPAADPDPDVVDD
ncbi:lycopene cyclase domain-containing protein [Halorubrum tebenquichense]|uniref:Lycopene cyclase domain protein n=1 Tax=Halorubrum tebenquichense DSM 14210 TaxID=1227485 RepID=M0DWY6_9EURY|nr:lycopene cyclase domain-containing protein [Halorubrum tebenquichense]ELZ38604.1 lycopene cyclase domain protein [Halorubrum tebenquichense DSM 14210]